MKTFIHTLDGRFLSIATENNTINCVRCSLFGRANIPARHLVTIKYIYQDREEIWQDDPCCQACLNHNVEYFKYRNHIIIETACAQKHRDRLLGLVSHKL